MPREKPDIHGVFVSKTEAMKRLVYLIAHGYTRYTTGVIPVSKSASLVMKFQDRYAIDRDSMQRYRSRKKGEANAFLVMWGEKDATELRWWLLVTEGQGTVTDLETLHDVGDKKHRIELTGYEVIRLPREGRAPDWTWRMTSDTCAQWQERLRASVRHKREDLLNQAIWSLRRVPGFSQVRKQAFSLVKAAEGDWKRVRGNGEPFPHTFALGFEGRHRAATKVQTADLAKKSRRKAAPASRPHRGLDQGG